MAKFEINLMKKVQKTASNLRSNPIEAIKVMNQLPDLLYQYARAVDLHSIYLQLYNAFKKHDEDINQLQQTFINFIKSSKEFPYIPGSEQLSPHQFITAHFFRGMMREEIVIQEDVSDTEAQFGSIVSVLNNYINELLDDFGNTPIIWSIANSQLFSLHKLLDAIEHNGPKEYGNIDVHCKQQCKGSALFLACVKGEKHQNTDRPKSLNPLNEMESVIKRLLHINASPTDKSDANERYSPLEIVVMRRSPVIVKLMVEHLNAPLDEEEFQRIHELLENMSFNQMEKKISDFSSVYTLPSEEEWIQNLDEMRLIIKNLKLVETSLNILK